MDGRIKGYFEILTPSKPPAPATSPARLHKLPHSSAVGKPIRNQLLGGLRRQPDPFPIEQFSRIGPALRRIRVVPDDVLAIELDLRPPAADVRQRQRQGVI